MKRNIGSKPALYPMPVIVVGAMNGDEPTWTPSPTRAFLATARSW